MKYTPETKMQMMKWKEEHPEQYAEIQRKSSLKYYYAHKEELNKKSAERARAKRLKLKEAKEQPEQIPEITI